MAKFEDVPEGLEGRKIFYIKNIAYSIFGDQLKCMTKTRRCLRPISLILILMGTLVFAGGCATNLDSDVAPGVDLATIETIFVERLPADNRGIEKLIAEELSQMGFQASSGDTLPEGQEFDAIVSYQDKWMWDITMYMLELRVQVLNPETRFVMASGSSYRTSLVRKSPEEMVEEVLQEMFK